MASGVPMNLNKAFNTKSHQPFLAKPHTCEFRKHALAIICGYLSNRPERIKIQNILYPWYDST